MNSTSRGDQFTSLVLSTFRLHGALAATGDRLVQDLGLSTARWQVLGMIVDEPRPVSGVARRMGLTRQSVQRTADRLVEEGFASTTPNPDHRSAKLYLLTPKGKKIMKEVQSRQAEWADRISEGLAISGFTTTRKLLLTLIDRLESDLDK